MTISDLLRGLVLTSVCHMAHAVEPQIYPSEGIDETPAFLLHVHGCEMNAPAIQRPIDRQLGYTVLVLPPSEFQTMRKRIDSVILNQWQTNTAVLKAKDKVVEFEDSGNMPAMKHWQQKFGELRLQLQREINQVLLPAHAKFVMANNEVPVFFGTSPKEPIRGKSLDELIELTGDRCNPLKR